MRVDWLLRPRMPQRVLCLLPVSSNQKSTTTVESTVSLLTMHYNRTPSDYISSPDRRSLYYV
jgi:hypothetical protein